MFLRFHDNRQTDQQTNKPRKNITPSREIIIYNYNYCWSKILIISPVTQRIRPTSMSIHVTNKSEKNVYSTYGCAIHQSQIDVETFFQISWPWLVNADIIKIYKIQCLYFTLQIYAKTCLGVAWNNHAPSKNVVASNAPVAP